MRTSTTSYNNKTTGTRMNASNYRNNNNNLRTATSNTPTGRWNPRPFSPTKFNNIGNEIKWKIGSFRHIYSQFNGAGKVTAFSPTTVNKWVRFVNSGTRVYKFNNAQFCRNFGNQWTNANPTSAYNYLRKQFGTGIKAVTRGKGSCWLVAATANVTTGPFKNYTW